MSVRGSVLCSDSGSGASSSSPVAPFWLSSGHKIPAGLELASRETPWYHAADPGVLQSRCRKLGQLG